MAAGDSIDPEGDSRMQSSGSESESMFPEEVRLSTPQAQQQALHQTTLSPPSSQGPAQNNLPNTAEAIGAPKPDKTVAGSNGKEGNLESGADENQDAPGWGWRNPKAKDEYERSLNSVLDPEFNLREFGELLDEADIVKSTGLRL